MFLHSLLSVVLTVVVAAAVVVVVVASLGIQNRIVVVPIRFSVQSLSLLSSLHLNSDYCYYCYCWWLVEEK